MSEFDRAKAILAISVHVVLCYKSVAKEESQLIKTAETYKRWNYTRRFLLHVATNEKSALVWLLFGECRHSIAGCDPCVYGDGRKQGIPSTLEVIQLHLQRPLESKDEVPKSICNR